MTAHSRAPEMTYAVSSLPGLPLARTSLRAAIRLLRETAPATPDDAEKLEESLRSIRLAIAALDTE